VGGQKNCGSKENAIGERSYMQGSFLSQEFGPQFMKTNSKLKREMDANFNAPLKLQNGLLPQ
jgi:hypothetical protein